MDPVFTLQWSEFVIAEKLQKLLPKKNGYSVLVPLSRQEEGIDLAILHRKGEGKSNILTIQVKSSRTWIGKKGKDPYHFTSRFSRFTVPDRADFVILVGMYAPKTGKTKRVSADWYEDCSLVFSRDEMRQFIKDCKTVKKRTPDQMFYFGFNDLKKVVLTRGDPKQAEPDFTKNLLEKRISELKKFLS